MDSGKRTTHTPPPPSPSPQSANSHFESPSPSNTSSSLQNLFFDAVEAANPPLRQLASQSTIGSLPGASVYNLYSSHVPSNSTPYGSAFNEHLHPRSQREATNRHRYHYETGSTSSGSSSPESTSGASTKAIKSGRGADLGVDSDSDGRRNGASEASLTDTYIIDSEEIGNGQVIPEKIRDADGAEREKERQGQNNREGEEDIYPGRLALTLIIIGLCLSVFLISLDRTIITTAIPFITNEFNSPEDIGWYGSSYLLTASAFQPLYGRVFMLFNMKWSYLVSLGMFLVGSLICGIAPTSIVLIIGRSIAGLGSAGILTGSFVVVSHIMPLRKRPVWTAIIGVMFGVGATVGPLLGGVFTDLVTWRWCFYFNLPVGGVTLASMVFYFHPPGDHALKQKSFIYRIGELDLIGNVILLGASIMLFLALQFTEQQIPWSSPPIIGLLVGAGLTFLVFCVWQWWKADAALIPPRILEQRSVGASCIIGFFIYAAILIQTYYLPIWFQAVKGYTAIQSGVAMIPYVAANAIASLLAGFFVSKNGYFTAPAIIGCAIGTVGCGLITTITPTSSVGTWIGFEILASAGIGLAIQQGFSAVQIVLPLDEVAIGTAAVVAFQSLGGAIFVSVGNTILQNDLLSASHHNKLPGVDIQAVIKGGASEFRHRVPPEAIPQLVAIYVRALQKVFVAAIPMAGLAFVAAMFLEWKSVKGRRLADEEAQARQGRAELERRIVEGQSMQEGARKRPLRRFCRWQTEDKETGGVEVSSPTGSSNRDVGIAL